MAIDLVLESLRRLSLFAGLRPEQIAEIGRGVRQCAFRKGEVIVEAGEPGDGAYLILAGDAVCRAGPDGCGPTEPVEPGSLVGELAMLVEHDYGSTVIAQGWVDCLKVERATLLDQMRADPDIADRVADAIRDRLTLVAADLQMIEWMFMRSIEHGAEAPLALLPPRAGNASALAAGLAQ